MSSAVQMMLVELGDGSRTSLQIPTLSRLLDGLLKPDGNREAYMGTRLCVFKYVPPGEGTRYLVLKKSRVSFYT